MKNPSEIHRCRYSKQCKTSKSICSVYSWQRPKTLKSGELRWFLLILKMYYIIYGNWSFNVNLWENNKWVSSFMHNVVYIGYRLSMVGIEMHSQTIWVVPTLTAALASLCDEMKKSISRIETAQNGQVNNMIALQLTAFFKLAPPLCLTVCISHVV